MMSTEAFQARARTFSFATHLLPSRHRQPVCQLYTFARALDDLVDEPRPDCQPEDTRAVLSAWRAWLDEPSPARAPDLELATGVFALLHHHRVRVANLQSLIDGVASDLDRSAMTTWPELRTYCMQVASSVGLAICDLLGAGDDPGARGAAVELSIAMQLTNILRDIGTDLAAGRVYLPATELQAHGSSRAHLEHIGHQAGHHGASAIDERFRSLMHFQIARARAHYERGLLGVARLPMDSQWGILVAAKLYAAILDAIENANYDVFSRRAATSIWFKLEQAAHCWAALRVPGAPATRAARPLVRS
jgi:15-cis-phytoene synthase